MGDDNNWRTPQFRQNIIGKIEEAITTAGMPTARNSREMENHVFEKAKTKEEYLGFAARLIIHVREMNGKKVGMVNSGGGGMSGIGGNAQVMPDPINALQTLARQGSGQGGGGPGGGAGGPQQNSASTLLQTLNRPGLQKMGMPPNSQGNLMGQVPGQIGGLMLGQMGNQMGQMGGQMQGQMGNQMGQMQGQIQGQMGNQMGQMGGQMQGQMGNQVSGQMQGQIQGQMGNQISGQIGSQMSNQMSTPMSGPVANQMSGQMGNQMTNQMGNQMAGQMGNQMAGQMSNQMTGQMGNQMPGHMGNQMSNQMGNQNSNQIPSQLGPQVNQMAQMSGQMQNQMSTQMNNQISNQMGGQMSQMGGQMGNQLNPQMSNQLHPQMRNQLQNQMGGQVGSNMANTIGNSVGNQMQNMQNQMAGQIGNQHNNAMHNQLATQLNNPMQNQMTNSMNMQQRKGADGTVMSQGQGFVGPRTATPNQFHRQSPTPNVQSPAGLSAGPSSNQMAASPALALAPSPGSNLGNMSGPPRSIGMVSSPSSSINTPGQALPAPSPCNNGQEEASPEYLEKVRELSRFIDPLRCMIARMDTQDSARTKVKHLYELLANPNKRHIQLETLLKCETVLAKLDFTRYVPANVPITTSTAAVAPSHLASLKEHVLFRPLLEAMNTTLQSPMANHTLHRTFGMPNQALFGPEIKLLPPPSKKRKSEDTSNDIPEVLQGEIARLDQRFKVSLDPTQQPGAKCVQLLCWLDDKHLPCVPPVSLTVPDDYPSSPPRCLLGPHDYCGTAFLLAVQSALEARVRKLPSKFSVSQLLDTWEMSVRQASAPTYTPPTATSVLLGI